jgi:hypothetical protein
MADVFAATFRAMIDDWMAAGLDPYVTLIATIAITARAAVMLIFRSR